MSKASPKLFLACASGQHINSAIFTARKAGKEQQEFLKVTMEDVLISGYTIQGRSSEATVVVPVDSVSLNFAKIRYEYAGQRADGSVEAPVSTGWDVAKNVKL